MNTQATQRNTQRPKFYARNTQATQQNTQRPKFYATKYATDAREYASRNENTQRTQRNRHEATQRRLRKNRIDSIFYASGATASQSGSSYNDTAAYILNKLE